MSGPSADEILALLDRLDHATADDLESMTLEFKPWLPDARENMRTAVESAVCFANAQGGAIVFGVTDRTRGRSQAITGIGSYDRDTWERAIYDSTRPNLRIRLEEISVEYGTRKLLVVRVPGGTSGPYGTSEGLYKVRVGKNCMPLDPAGFLEHQISSGAVDWSGRPAEDTEIADLDPVEIARARNILRRTNPESDLLGLNDRDLLVGLGVIRRNHVTNAGLLLFGRPEIIHDRCPQHQVHYVLESSDTEIARNDSYRQGLISVLEAIENSFTGPANPEQELSVGLHKLRIPAFPLDVVREAVLNAVTHRDYSDPGEVLVRQTRRELVITSPGGFIGNITPRNILRHEPISRNRTLAEAFEKLRLVERAGIGRGRIFIPMLSYGKRIPQYETDGLRVTLRIFDETFDARMAALIAKWKREGREVNLDGLLVLVYLKENRFIDIAAALELLQLRRADAHRVLDALAQPRTGLLDRRGHTRAAIWYLTKGVAKDLLGKAAYTKTKGINPVRYAEMVRAFVNDHGAITPQECRELLGLGESQSARVEVSRLLGRLSGSKGFLRKEGTPPKTTYYLREEER